MFSSNYLCFCEHLAPSSVWGSLVEISPSAKDTSEIKKNGQVYISKNSLPEQLSGENGFVKLASRVGPKVQYQLNGETVLLDLFSCVAFINAFQNPEYKRINKFTALISSQEKIVTAFDNAIKYMSRILDLNARSQVDSIQDLKIRNTAKAQLKLLETPIIKKGDGVLKIKSRIKKNKTPLSTLQIPFARCDFVDKSFNDVTNSSVDSSNS